MAIDSQKRTTLKALGAASAAVAIPSIASAVYSNADTSPEQADPSSVVNSDLVVSFSDKHGIDGSREVVVTNRSNKPVNVSLVYPSVVSTPEGQYDLNSLLVNGTRTFAPNQAITLNISTTKRLPAEKRTPWMHPAESMISVRTRSPGINGGETVTTKRSMFSLNFA